MRRYGRPDAHRHSIQLEINRKLYTNEATLALTGGLDTLQTTLKSVVALLLQTDPKVL